MSTKTLGWLVGARDGKENVIHLGSGECYPTLSQPGPNVICDRKVFELQRHSRVTLHVSPKTPILEGSKKITSTKILNSPKEIFPE